MEAKAPHIDFSKIKHLLTDSRNLHDAEHTMFFCLEGNGRNGTDYIDELYNKGVRHFVVPAHYQGQLDAFFIRCQKPLEMLQYASLYHNLAYEGTIVGITGSNGKTVVKEWLFQIVSKQMYTYRSPKSYNSQVGVPLSLWEVPQQSKVAIIEAGISQVDEMQRLANIIRPKLGIFTNIGNAHQENFYSLETKAREKLKLFRDNKTIVYRKDNGLIHQLLNEMYPDKELVSWSLTDQQHTYYFNIDKRKRDITLFINQKEIRRFAFPFTDDASLENIAHCIVAAIQLNVDVQLIDVSSMEAIAMRLEQKQGIHGCNLINDAYNSDILSLSIALDALNKLSVTKKTPKTLFISDIVQSGLSPLELYTQMANLVNNKTVDKLIGIGEQIMLYQHLFNVKNIAFYPTTSEYLNHFNAVDFQDETILFKGARHFQFEQIIRLLEERRHQTILEIDLNALRENLNYFRRLLHPTTLIMGMVKAFAYGSGSIAVARTLQQQGCNYLAVAVADEGVELRNSGITLPIIVMTPERNSFEVMIEYHLEPAIYSFSELKAFLKVSQKMKTNKYPVHIKFDTGMHRLGFQHDDVPQLSAVFGTQHQLEVISVFSHLAAADESQWDHFTEQQVKALTDITTALEQSLGHKVIKHILNSAGTERFTTHQMDMVRLGIGMYGISIVGEQLQQLATLKTAITQVRTVPKEETIGYGRKGLIDADSRIATLPIGYADGLNRLLGNGKGYVLVNGYKAPFVGNICMDLSMIDITHTDAQEGNEVVLLGEDLPATTLAQQLGTIPYEVLTSISQRVKRVYVE